MRDSQRSRVYAAEGAWELQLDAARRGAPRATVAGSSVLLPSELLFGTLEAAQAYADGRLDGVPPVVLRRRRGHGQAHWEPPGVIALPVPAHGQPWALRERNAGPWRARGRVRGSAPAGRHARAP